MTGQQPGAADPEEEQVGGTGGIGGGAYFFKALSDFFLSLPEGYCGAVIKSPSTQSLLCLASCSPSSAFSLRYMEGLM